MPDTLTEENLQSRVRGVTLMVLSNKFGHMLSTTGSRDRRYALTHAFRTA